MTRPEYVLSDFDPPLSEDAKIMLIFVQEKKRVIRRLRRWLIAAWVAGPVIGAVIGRFLP